MSRRARRSAGENLESREPAGEIARRPLSPRRRVAFLAITLLFPFVLLALLEGALRLTWDGGSIPLFVPAEQDSARLLVVNRDIARRYFHAESRPPTPPREPFAREKPAGALRIFAIGESSTAGFPYPRNVLFSRLVRDALRQALPGDSIEVVNLGLAATNSYALLDQIDEVLDQRPDAVLVYAGHNEYYGALGVGSTVGSGLPPSLVRASLAVQRWRLGMAMRRLLEKVRGGGRAISDETASFMESVVRDQHITLGSEAYTRGVRQR
jgi:hypothetical protein